MASASVAAGDPQASTTDESIMREEEQAHEVLGTE